MEDAPALREVPQDLARSAGQGMDGDFVAASEEEADRLAKLSLGRFELGDSQRLAHTALALLRSGATWWGRRRQLTPPALASVATRRWRR
jgi:hypothetical protein